MMKPHPVANYGFEIEFSDGSRVNILEMAKEWVELRDQLYGDRCMVPDCNQSATTDIHLWGRLVGRGCEQHGWDFAANAF